MNNGFQAFRELLGQGVISLVLNTWDRGRILDDGWKGLRQHLFLVAAAAMVLAKRLSLPDADIVRLVTAALLHDARKRLEIEAQTTTEWTVEMLKLFSQQQTEFLLSCGWDRSVIEIIEQSDYDCPRLLLENPEAVGMLAKLLMYSDAICGPEGFVTITERMNRLRAQYPLLDQAGAELGLPGNTFDSLELAFKAFEQELAQLAGDDPRTFHASVASDASLFLHQC